MRILSSLVLVLVTSLSVQSQELALKFNVVTLISRVSPEIIRSAQVDTFAYDVLEVMDKSDAEVSAFLEDKDWYYGVDVYQEDDQGEIIQMIKSDTEAVFRDPLVKRSAIATATDGHRMVVVVVSYR